MTEFLKQDWTVEWARMRWNGMVEWSWGAVASLGAKSWLLHGLVSDHDQCKLLEQEERTTENHQMYQQGEQELERTEIVLGSHLLIVMKHTLIIYCPDTDCWPAGHWTTSLLIFWPSSPFFFRCAVCPMLGSTFGRFSSHLWTRTWTPHCHYGVMCFMNCSFSTSWVISLIRLKLVRLSSSPLCRWYIYIWMI